MSTNNLLYKKINPYVQAFLLTPESRKDEVNWPQWVKDIYLDDPSIIRYSGSVANPVVLDCLFKTWQGEDSGLLSIYSSITGYSIVRYGNYLIRDDDGSLSIMNKNKFERDYLSVETLAPILVD
jgi:hypothetical protein